MRIESEGIAPPAPVFLWTFGALSMAGLAVIGIDFVTCGSSIFEFWPRLYGIGASRTACAQMYLSTIPHAMWIAYVCIGLAAILIAFLALSPTNSSGTLQRRLACVFAFIAIALACVPVVVLGEYYLFAVVAANWLLFRMFRPRLDLVSTLFEIGVIFLSWVAAATISWAQPFSAWLFGTLNSQQYGLPLVVFAFALILNTYVLRHSNEQGTQSKRSTAIAMRAADLLALLLFALLSFRQDFFGDPTAVFHWGFFVGPAELVRQGGWLLWDVPSQYGFLSILAVAALPFKSVWTSMYALNATLVWSSACMLYFVFRSLRVGRLSFVFALFASLAMVYLMPGLYPNLNGPQPFPSVGAFRFFWVEALLMILLLGYAKKSVFSRRINVAAIGSITWLLGFLWSAESAIYVTIIWLPSLFALVLAAGDRQGFRECFRATSRSSKLVLGILLLPALLLAVSVAVIHAIYLLALGHGPDYFAFYEFGLQYGAGFATYPVNALGSGWLLVFAFAVCTTAFVLVLKQAASWNALPLLYGAAAVIWVLSSYFISRSADSNVTNLFTPIWLAVAAALFVLDREGMNGTEVTYLRLALIAPLTVSVCLTIGNFYWMRTVASEILTGYRGDITALLPRLPAEALAVLSRADVSPADPIVFDGMLFPAMADAGADSTIPRSWLPVNPSTLFQVIPPSRRLVYFQRFIARRPMEGWFLRTHSPTQSCETFDTQHFTTKSYITPSWDLSWCSLTRPTSRQRPETQPTFAPTSHIETRRLYSFVANFLLGHINSTAKVSTPTGRGVLVLPVGHGSLTTQTITVVAGFRYTYALTVKPGDVLKFEAAKPFSIGGTVRAFIDESAGGRTQRIFQEDLEPATESGPVWKAFSVTPRSLAGPVTLTFGCDSTADPTAAWVSYADPAIYGKKP